MYEKHSRMTRHGKTHTDKSKYNLKRIYAKKKFIKLNQFPFIYLSPVQCWPNFSENCYSFISFQKMHMKWWMIVSSFFVCSDETRTGIIIHHFFILHYFLLCVCKILVLIRNAQNKCYPISVHNKPHLLVWSPCVSQDKKPIKC